MDTPFAMNFDQIKAQADANMQADKGQSAQSQVQQQEQSAAEGKTFLDMVEEAQNALNQENTGNEPKSVSEQTTEAAPTMGVPSGPSFEELFAQAQTTTDATTDTATKTAGAASFDDLFKQAEGAEQTQSQPTVAEQPTVQQNVATEQSATQKPALSFDDLMNQAQAQVAEAPAEEAPAEKVPAEEAPAEKVPAEEAPAEKSSTQEAPAEGFMNAPESEESAAETPTAEAAPETPAKETKAGKGKRSKQKKTEETKTEEKETKEPLPNVTDDYKVDLTGKNQSETTTPAALSMEALFTPDEISAFRADIRTFVRKEFKNAMVDAMKELLTEFSE